MSDLTPEELEALLRRLDPDDRDQAARRYEEIRRKLIRYFEFRGSGESEELTDVTINRVARRFAQGEAPQADPFRYSYGVARLVFMECLRHEASREKALKTGDPAARPYDEEPEDHRLESLRHCLDLLPEDQRTLLLRYHQGEHNKQTRRELCRELGIEMNALRIRVHRLRRRVETCIEERLR